MVKVSGEYGSADYQHDYENKYAPNVVIVLLFFRKLWRGSIIAAVFFTLADKYLGFQLLIYLIYGISLVLALISYGTAAVGLVFVNDEISVFVLIDTECTWLLVVDADEKSHFLQRHIMGLTEALQFIYCFWHSVCRADHIFIRRTAVGAHFIGIVYKRIAVAAFYFHLFKQCTLIYYVIY